MSTALPETSRVTWMNHPHKSLSQRWTSRRRHSSMTRLARGACGRHHLGLLSNWMSRGRCSPASLLVWACAAEHMVFGTDRQRCLTVLRHYPQVYYVVQLASEAAPSVLQVVAGLPSSSGAAVSARLLAVPAAGQDAETTIYGCGA